MATDIMKGQWMQMKGQVKTWWGKLTDDDLTEIEGDRDKLAGRLQERYGYNRQQAMDEINLRFKEWEQQHPRRI